MHAVASNAAQLDCDLRKVMELVSSNKTETMDALLNAKDGEIARWRDELKFLSENQKLRSMELELQVGYPWLSISYSHLSFKGFMFQ